MIQDRIKEDKPILIDFYTTTCSICTVLDQSLKEVSKEFKDGLDLIKIDVDKDKINTIHFDATYKIMGVPTLMLFKNNKLLWKYNGVLFPDDLINNLKKHL